MAKEYYGANRGQHQTDVQSGAADLGLDVQVVIDLTHVDVAGGMSREEALRLVEGAIIPQIMKGIWPPA